VCVCVCVSVCVVLFVCLRVCVCMCVCAHILIALIFLDVSIPFQCCKFKCAWCPVTNSMYINITVKH